ncbi:MAG TPA: biotin transporter BioY [Candidatus Dormibacteraeota bacterium]|nr:biotin transporter BioY [Candidatus Dormibacteraeota bacterium]
MRPEAGSSALVREWIGKRTVVGDIGLVLAFSLLIGLLAHLVIPLPFTPVPVTGQTFGVLLAGAVLGSRLGTATLMAYIVEGLAGLPVFAAGTRGPATYGYLAGFVVAAFIIGWLCERGWDRDAPRILAAMVAGEVAIYVFGLLWLARFVPAPQLLALGFFPFLLGDTVKLVAAAIAAGGGRRLARGG